jgi:lipopolysaccharide/colanic/teichoic acid biosynthesis glycosyltransferase
MYRSFFKRTLDVIFSLTALIVLSPILLVVSIAIYLETGER